MGIAECYSMAVQCDFGPHILPVRGEFTGRSSADVWRQAKAKGWKLYAAQHKARCPHCAATLSNRMSKVKPAEAEFECLGEPSLCENPRGCACAPNRPPTPVGWSDTDWLHGPLPDPGQETAGCSSGGWA